MPERQAPAPPFHANVLVSAAQRVERAAGDFRRGMPVAIGRGAGVHGVAIAAETVNDRTLKALMQRFGAPALVLTHARAKTLKIRLYTEGVVMVALDSDADAARLRAIADPSSDLATPMKGPFTALRGALPPEAAASVKLAKLAGLLPATALFRNTDAANADALALVGTDDILGFDDEGARSLEIVARAHVPLEGAPDAQMISFRPADGGDEHHAILIGTPVAPALTRLHSACFTGDLLGSLRCDCGEQLRGAIAAIARAGGGILLYLAQEGRGIGLMNKLRAYRLQDQGFDTFEANTRLGFEADERRYDIAARMLRLLGFESVRLMTNNPVKVTGLEGAGIKVAMRVPHAFPSTEHNRDYLLAKKDSGHSL